MSKGLTVFDEEIFDEYESDIIGYFEASTPVVLCRDIGMIKHVMIKDFSYFVNRRVFYSFLEFHYLKYFRYFLFLAI